MLLDKLNTMSDAQSLAGAAATTLCTNSIYLRGTSGFTTDELGNTPLNDPGRSPGLDLLVEVVEDFAGGTSCKVDLVSDDNEALSSPTVLSSTAVIAEASLKAGYQFRIALPVGISEAYLGCQYTTVGTHTAGKVTASLVPHGSKQSASGTMS